MTSEQAAAAEARRAARAAWPVRRFDLGSEPEDDLSHLTPEERVSLVWTLTVAAWTASGRELPSLPRSEWPGTVVRRP